MSISAEEQLLLEMINRARLDPLGEAQRFGIDLNAGLPDGTLSGQPMQVLAPDADLAAAAQGHSEWMLATDTFSHTGSGGSSAGERMSSSGYTFSGAWTWGENIAWWGTTGTPDLEYAIRAHHEGLFLSAGHRANLLKSTYREIGVAQVEGGFQGYNASMLTQNFAKSGSFVFVTGVAYDDTDADAFYSVGEGRSGVSFSVGAASVLSGAAGGYSLELASTTAANVTVTRGAFVADVTLDLSAGNAKLDLVDGSLLLTSVNTVLGSGASAARLLGVGDFSLTGNDAANKLDGNAGRNLLKGGAGHDTISGGQGADTIEGGTGDDVIYGGDAYDIIYAGAGNDRVWGGNGRDLIYLGDGDDVFFDNAQTGAHSHDTVFGGNGNDTFHGGGGNDVIHGEAGADVIAGGDGDDSLFGGTDYDTIYAGAGDDRVWGGNGSDLIFLGDGNDIFYDNGQSGVHARDRVFGGNGDDWLIGGGGNDSLYGEAGNDTVTGGAGDDAVFGGGGDDLLDGEAGNDVLFGGAGADIFVFGQGCGADIVLDFEDGIDTLRLDRDLWGGASLSASEVIGAFASVSGEDVLFDFGSGNSITLRSISDTAIFLDDMAFI